MTAKELNLKLIQAMPELSDKYTEEISWQDGDETGSHVIYADVFVPYIERQILSDMHKGVTINENTKKGQCKI